MSVFAKICAPMNENSDVTIIIVPHTSGSD